MATSDRTIHGATAEVNLTGLESSLIELVRWDGDVLKFNDVSSPTVADVTRVTQIDGLFDDAPLRQERVARPDTYGTNPGIPFYDEKLISLTGYVKAGNFPMLRHLQRAIKKSLSFKTISNADLETWTLRITTPSSAQYFMLNVQPASIQMPELQDSAEYKRPFLITLKASDPRIYSAEATVTALVAATQSRSASINSSPYVHPTISTFHAVDTYVVDTDTSLGTAKYILAHIPPYVDFPVVTDRAEVSMAGAMLQYISAGNYLTLLIRGDTNDIELWKFDSGSGTILHTFTLPYEARNKDIYFRAYMASSSSVACQAYTSRPFTIANKASEPNILLDSSYTLTGGDLTKFGGTVTGVKRGIFIENSRDASSDYPWFTWLDYEVNSITESPLSESFTIGGDVPSPVRCRIDGPIVDPTVRITQTGGSSPVAFAEDISFLLYTTLTSGQYVEWDPWTSTWTHSAGGSILTATGNRYSDLSPGTYTAVMRGSGTDTTHSALTIYTRAAIS